MALTITRNQGAASVAGVAEVATATFGYLGAGFTFTLAGITISDSSGSTAVDAADAFYLYATGTATSAYPYITFSGVLSTDYSVSHTNGSNILTFSGKTPSNLNDLSATGANGGNPNTIAVAITTQGVAPTLGVTETTDVGFVDLVAGEKLTIGGLTVTATATVTAANVAAAFASTATGNTTTGLTFSGSLIGFTSSAVSNGNHVVFTSVTSNSNVDDLVVNYSPVITTIPINGTEDVIIPIMLSAVDMDGSVASFKVTNLPTDGVLYLDVNLTMPVTTVNSSITTASNTLNLYFKPNANWNGTTAFNYVAVDNNNAESTPATQNIDVNPVPDAPTIGTPPISSIAITQGTVSTHETAVVTFAALNKGDFFTLNGVSVYATNAATATQVAAVFSNLSINSHFNNDVLFGKLVLNGTMYPEYGAGVASGSTVTFTSPTNSNMPDLALMGTGVTLLEAPTLTATGSFPINDVDFATGGDTVSVEVAGVNVSGYSPNGNGNAASLAALLNNSSTSFLLLSPETLTANGNVNWNFDIANIPDFASLLNGESINFSYQIEATDSNNAVSWTTLNFNVQGKTQILDATSVDGLLANGSAEQQVATVTVQTENGTLIRLFDTSTGLDVTNKFNLGYDVAKDLNAGIKTLTFELKDGVGYNGTKSLIAKSFLDADTGFSSVQSTFTVPSFTIPDGADVYYGTTGNDLITGSAGSDTLSGGLGDDTYFINDANNVIVEDSITGGGFDTVHSTVSYTLPLNVENLFLGGNTAINGTGNTVGNNWIHGNDAVNTLDDGGSAPSLPTIGNIAPDTLSGGKGSDIYIVHSSGTMVMGETNIGGVDTVQSFVNFVLPKNVENLTLMGTLNASGKGNNLANIIIGNTGNNTLDGGAGADVLTGGAGDDLYIIDRATDVVDETVTGSGGTDTVQSIVTYTLPANVENLTLVGLATISGIGNVADNVIIGNGAANTLNGDAGNDILRGDNGNDSLIGGAGSDTLIGGIGVDTLTGGGGTDTFSDTFMFDSLMDMGAATRRDVVTDFQTGVDKIDMYGTFTLTGSAGTLGTAPFTTTANQIRWSFYGDGIANPYYAVVQGNTDTNPATVEFEIKLNGVTALAAGDFILT